ncbi:hypothetical protein AAES_29317 [Amazona aestiva]|uniref:OCA domain-containing protein n=1 Tax=Amazona aestiva TaxID=12930 RepID=A0A0Q3S7C0_AMAAE|nr:hypothetical protein AAES_29317 [Amazona aestiva]
METVPTDFGKRVYQGVRVKHTVKDLLAEKRSRQSSGSHFSGSISTSQSSFVQMPGSPTTAGYYGIRRSFTTELDFHNTKQFVSDVYSSPLGSKPFSSDLSATQGFPTLLDPYLTDQYGDYRATPLTAGTSSFFSPSVPPLLPSFPNDTTHFLLVSPFDAEPISSVPNLCPSWQFSNCLSCEESPSYLEQLVDSCLQTDAPSDPAFSGFQTSQTSSHYASEAFQPVPHCFNQGLTAGSPSSADLSSPLNYSCSPPQLSPFTTLTHSPSSALDSETYSYPAEEWSCHTPSTYTTSTCCCTAYGSQHVDNRVPQYFPCPSTDCMDYLPPMAMADDFFRRDRNCDICYS